VKVALVVAWSWAILTVLRGSISDHPLRPSDLQKFNLVAVAPEGWGFFTRNPREPGFQLYQQQGHTWRQVMLHNGEARTLFGIKRDARIQGVELQGLIYAIPDSAWTQARAPLSGILERTDLYVHEVTNRALHATMCGDYVLMRQEPVPWAWASARDRLDMPSRSVRLRVDCGATPPSKGEVS
jgi:antimicrobial peptide system SdpA family protein